jgi:hypothetical protein
MFVIVGQNFHFYETFIMHESILFFNRTIRFQFKMMFKNNQFVK